MKKILILFLFLSSLSFSQSGNQSTRKFWSKDNKLTKEDFKIKINDSFNEAIYSQFSISYSAKGFDFFKRNLNMRVQNIFLKSASWIDTLRISETHEQIKFQQLQFDLSEVYTRKFRKRLLINKNKITKGVDLLNQISDNILTEFSEERMKLIKETEGGRNIEKLKIWRKKINSLLNQLDVFRFENKKKIKLKSIK